MLDADPIGSVKTTSRMAKLKMASEKPLKGMEEMKGAKRTDKLSLSSEALETIALNRFVDILRNLPDVTHVGGRELDFSSPKVVRAVAAKIADTFS